LVQLRMLVEATLDFPEEEIDFLKKADAQGQLERLAQSLDDVLAQAAQGALLRDGIRVVIAGQPNAGKSSLLNALAGAELAIVTPYAGTTRDKVQETIQIEGVPIHIVDTAGLRSSDDVVEKIGIARAWEAIEGADAVLFLHDLTRANAIDYIAADAVITSDLVEKLPENIPVINVWNKADCATATDPLHEFVISAKTGEGLARLRQKLLETAGWQATPGGLFAARARHVQSLRNATQHVQEATLHLHENAQSLDLLAEELRLAQNTLSEITGEFSSDDLLGVIFSKFCIGK
jgi:tRNA modification GTPase